MVFLVYVEGYGAAPLPRGHHVTSCWLQVDVSGFVCLTCQGVTPLPVSVRLPVVVLYVQGLGTKEWREVSHMTRLRADRRPPAPRRADVVSPRVSPVRSDRSHRQHAEPRLCQEVCAGLLL